MLMYNLSISLILFQGIFIEKKSHLYIKISLFEKNKEFCSKKVWSSNDKTGINFSKELKLNLQEREARNCSLLLQLKEYSGIGLRSEVQRFVKHWLSNLCQARRSANCCCQPRVTRAATTAPCWTNREIGSSPGIMQNAFDSTTYQKIFVNIHGRQWSFE